MVVTKLDKVVIGISLVVLALILGVCVYIKLNSADVAPFFPWELKGVQTDLINHNI